MSIANYSKMAKIDKHNKFKKKTEQICNYV